MYSFSRHLFMWRSFFVLPAYWQSCCRLLVATARSVMLGLGMVLISTIFMGARAYAANNQLPIIHYANISNNDDGFSLSAEDLAIHLDYMLAQGYHIIPLENALVQLYKNNLSPKTVALTFEGNIGNFYALAYPLLKARHIPALFFARTDNSLNNILPRLKDMNDGGISFGALPAVQVPLNTLSPSVLITDLSAGKKLLAEAVGSNINVLNYPFGAANGRISKAVSNIGYKYALTNATGVNTSADSEMMLARFTITQRIKSVEELAARLNSKGIRVKDFLPTSYALAVNTPPAIGFTYLDDGAIDKVNCAIDQMPATKKIIIGTRIEFRWNNALAAGHHRLTCSSFQQNQASWFGRPIEVQSQ